jgi:hypothetical protein
VHGSSWGLGTSEGHPEERGSSFIIFFLLFLPLCFLCLPVVAREAPLEFNLEAFDMPGDGGGSIGLRWQFPPLAQLDHPSSYVYRIFMSAQQDGKWRQLAEFPTNTYYESEVSSPWWVWGAKSPARHFFQIKSNSDLQLANGKLYFFKVVLTDGQHTVASVVASAVPQANLFNWAKLNNLVFMLAFSATVLLWIRRARRNPHIFLRRIPGLDAVEEAVGRATEMGRPILYLTGSGELGGSGDPSNLSTIAATIILGEVAKRTASYGAALQIPHRAAIVMAICQEIVKEAYLAAGRPDTYKEDMNFFITADQFAYTAAVDGIMLRERPAANFFMGYYYAESLLLAETGATTGAIQIAGTDAEHQLPFFIAACDYTLIGEELYAASAYLSREPTLVGPLRSQDIGKGFLLVAMVLGSLLMTIGELLGTPVLRTALEIFSDFK